MINKNLLGVKNGFIIFFLHFLPAILAATPGPLLIGITDVGGINNTGTFISYVAGDTALNAIFSVPAIDLGDPFSSGQAFAEDFRGKLYGINRDYGAGGSIYQFDRIALTYTLTAEFNSGPQPTGHLTLAGNGNFYGLTTYGGVNDAGTIFSYSADSNLISIVADLPSQALPFGNLILGQDGQLYGLTQSDGDSASGTLFQFNTTTNTYRVLYNLPNGASPQGTLLEAGIDTFYGYTNDMSIAATPGFYGGSLFQYILKTNTFNLLYDFDTAQPVNRLIRAPDGKLYGCTELSGAYGLGELFSFDVDANVYVDLWDFGNGDDGSAPAGGVYLASDGLLYGLTNTGGRFNEGTIYSYDIYNHKYVTLVNLNDSTGYAPNSGYFLEIGYRTVFRQPVSQTLCNGTQAYFSSLAAGMTSIQWQMSTDGGSHFTDIPNAVDTAYSFTANASQDDYQYRAIFRADSLFDTSAVAVLTVYPPGDTSITISLCNDVFVVGADTFSASGAYSDTLHGASSYGCDSIVNLHLTVVGSLNDSAISNEATCAALQTGASYQWFDCEGSQIEGATLQSYTAIANGNYKCVVSIGNCSDTTNCVTAVVNSLTDPGYNYVHIYPNPVASVLNLVLSQSITHSISIYDVNGRQLITHSSIKLSERLDLSGLSNGVYFITISTDAWSSRMKIVKTE
jgi:uncharacterized repeat protein (TIGR03803 family)